MTKTVPPRPTMADIDVRKEVILTVLSAVRIWISEYHADLVGTADDQLVDMMLSSFDADPFTLAKNLEQTGWPSNTALVSLLIEDMNSDRELRSAVKRWVSDNGIHMSFREGDRVALPWCARGIIVDREITTATVLIAPWDRRELWKGRAGWQVPFEQVIPIMGTVGDAP